MFENQFFDDWLQKKSDEVLSKMDKEVITTEEMLILSLKAQTNHFHHIDVEFRNEFKKIDKRFDNLDASFDKKFESMDVKFDRLYKASMWISGIIFTTISGMLIKMLVG